jgi:LacI family transcriptional regulator
MLTTVHQDANRKGEIAAESMMTLLEGGQVAERSTILPVRLVERDSVRSLPTGWKC